MLRVEIDFLVRWLFAALLFILLLQFFLGYMRIDFPRVDFPGDVILRDVMDVNREQSFPTWLESILFLLCSVTLGIIALVTRLRRDAWAKFWTGLAALFLVASIDEVAGFHEHLSRPVRNLIPVDGLLYYAWVIPVGLFMILLAGIYFRFFLHLPSALRRDLVLAALLFLGGALGLESIGGLLASQGAKHSLLSLLETTLEEGLEFAGLIVLFRALLRHLRSLIGEISMSLV